MRAASEHLPDVVRQGADVEAGGGGHAKTDAAALFDVRCPMSDIRCAQNVQLMDGYRRWFEINGLVLASLFVRTNTGSFFRRKRGRHLQERAAKSSQDRFKFRVRRPSVIGHRTSDAVGQRRRIVGRRRDPEPHVREVFLLVGDQELGQARGVADEQDEEARRERIERAGVPDPRRLQRPPREGDDVVRGGTARLVEEEAPCNMEVCSWWFVVCSSSRFAVRRRLVAPEPLQTTNYKLHTKRAATGRQSRWPRRAPRESRRAPRPAARPT